MKKYLLFSSFFAFLLAFLTLFHVIFAKAIISYINQPAYFYENDKKYELVNTQLDHSSVRGFGEVKPIIKNQGGAYLSEDKECIIIQMNNGWWYVFDLNGYLLSCGDKHINYYTYRSINQADKEQRKFFRIYFKRDKKGYYLEGLKKFLSQFKK